jgi:hypothetical protein
MRAAVAVQIGKCINTGITTAAIADGLKAWNASDSWSPTQIPMFVNKAANRAHSRDWPAPVDVRRASRRGPSAQAQNPRHRPPNGDWTMTRDDVIDVLTAVAAADRRTVGQIDVDIWQAVIGELRKDLAMRAVGDHLRNSPGVWLEPGHVYQRARALHREELEHEPSVHRVARQTKREALAAADVSEIAENVSTGRLGRAPAHPTPRYWAAKAACDNFPWRNGRPVHYETRTPEYQAAAHDAIREYREALAEARKQTAA